MDTSLSDLLLILCDVSTRKRSRRNSSGLSAASHIPGCSQSYPTRFLAWACPDNMDCDESIYQNAILVHLLNSIFVHPHQHVVVNHLDDKKHYVFALNLRKKETTTLQTFVMEHLGNQWTYLHPDVYSALVSKGKKVSLPLESPSGMS
jgi:hypothetical protein